MKKFIMTVILWVIFTNTGFAAESLVREALCGPVDSKSDTGIWLTIINDKLLGVTSSSIVQKSGNDIGYFKTLSVDKSESNEYGRRFYAEHFSFYINFKLPIEQGKYKAFLGTYFGDYWRDVELGCNVDLIE